jgi:2-polyprenyl-3-methyl-5-hydroxy-6-metoxy-1,4-benzoquinol methylase
MMLRKLQSMLAQRRQREQIYCTAEYWDSKAVELEGDAVSMWVNNNLNRLYHDEQLMTLRKLLPNLQDRDVLDLGCGTGRLSRWLASQGARVLGIDFSERSIAIATRASAGGNPAHRTQSMFELEDRGRFDIVVSWGSITVACRTADDVRDVMRRLRRALRTGGRVVLLEPVHKGFLHRVLAMDLSEFIGLMEESGFKVRSHLPMHFWPARLALAFFELPTGITRVGYHIGQTIMRIPGFRRMGDYTAIDAVAEP